MGRAGFAGSRVASSSLTGGASSRWYSLTTASRQAAASPTSSSAVPLSRLSETFADGTSGAYVEDMYQAWKRDANSVHASWASYFRSVDAGRAPGEAFTAPPTLRGATAAVPPAGGVSEEDLSRRVSDSMRLLLLVRAYQVRGHTLAKLDPLTGGPLSSFVPPELLPSTYGFTDADMDRPIHLGGESVISGFLSHGSATVTLREILVRLKQTYCSTIGVEYMHIPDRHECNWIRERVETPEPFSFSPEQKFHLLDRLTWATLFERFLAMKYQNTKRFGLDGCETLIPGMKTMIDTAADLGVESVVIGMPHRGRLNVLANVVRKPLDALLHEFDLEGNKDHSDDLGLGTGDVKYHLGTSYDRPTASGKKVHLSLVANPSHLEAVNPVVEGKARAKQQYMGDTERTRVMPVLLHGDAAFASQGVVYETLDLGIWKNFTTGGTIHIVVNNQVGFTTALRGSRTNTASSYPTDVAKTVNAPIFHVNGDDPEAVVHTLKLAAEYRQAFKKDVVIDIICYRRAGHNEGDEPRYTQPQMYRMIEKHQSTLDLYRAKLKAEGVVDDARIKQMEDFVNEEHNKAFQASSTHVPNKADWFSSYWKGFKSAHQYSSIRPTAIPDAVISKIGATVSSLPEGMKLHPNLEKLIKRKKLMFESGKNIDWGTAEQLALGSLALEGNLIRLTGQDVERGTFSHRHAVLHDRETGETYQPLRHIDPAQAPVFVHNSSLSEYAVLGYELGFSLENPNSLVLWEAQFGDFANGAQVIVDQFISSGEQKWQRQSGLVMLLPHGYDGQGPEHSSARLERFLQLSDSDPFVIPEMDPTERRQIQQANIQVVNVTTPANYFHALRRQVHRDFRKPLIVMSPKRLLRHPRCVSSLEEFSDKGTQPRFRRVINDTAENPVSDDRIRKVLFCSGNVYYDLAERREKAAINDVAIVRVEQLAPFPFDRVAEQALRYRNATTGWVQEEPMNMGAWTFVSPHMRTALAKAAHAHAEPAYFGRAVSASTATGSAKAHKRQLTQLLDAAFS